MRRLTLFSCVALLTAAAPANAGPAPISSQVAASSDSQQTTTLSGGKPAQPTAEKKICKQLDTTGSRLPRRSCLTAKEWKQVEQDLQN